MEYCKVPEYSGPFRQPVLDFIEYKRGLGYDYGKAIVCKLREMDLFFAAHGVTEAVITEEMFEMWTALRDGESSVTRQRRANVLIAFSRYLQLRGYANIFIGELPCKTRRPQYVPYIFTKSEIAALFDAASVRSVYPEGKDYMTFTAMLSLYYGCGLRKTEAQALRLCDVDFGFGRIQILDSKNHVSRIVVASESVRAQLDTYRARCCTEYDSSSRMFQCEKSPQFGDYKLYRIYRQVLTDAGIPPREDGKFPRIHDLRHTFCVHALESMTEKGFDLYVSLPLLVKYLGHNCISETEYYLRLVDENFTSITEKSRAYAPTLFPKADYVDAE